MTTDTLLYTGMKKKLLKCLKNQFFPYIYQVDESAVEVLHIVSGPDSMARNSHVDSYRYPKAGIDCLSDLSEQFLNKPRSINRTLYVYYLQ